MSSATDTGVNGSMLAKETMVRRGNGAYKHRKAGNHVLGKGDGWNGRLVVMGNGGQRGFVPFPDVSVCSANVRNSYLIHAFAPQMKQIMSRYRFAVAGTNLGHFSSSAGVTWVNGTQFNDTILDWASRANHVTLQLAEGVIDTFYGASAGIRVQSESNRVRRYYTGSSVGGARGLSAVQVHPGDYHGVLLGPPAQNFMNMNIGQIHLSKAHNKTFVGKGFFTQGVLYGLVQDVVLRQCDELDGVKDGIIADPWKCKPDLAPEMLCGGQGKYSQSRGTCLTQEQINAVNILYSDTYLDDQFVYPRWLPGLESSASSLKATEKKASGWTQLVVYKQPALNTSFNPFTDIGFADVQTANAADPGKANAAQTDLSDFVNQGGKMMIYHGGSDMVISPMATVQYFEHVLRDTKAKDGSAADSLKFYFVPGMQHSRGGPGAWHFGGVTQTEAGNRPLHYDTQHDMLLALVSWVEGGRAPGPHVAARYEARQAITPGRPDDGSGAAIDLPIPTLYQNFNWGLVDTRLLCPWPQRARYQGGQTTGKHGYRAFVCA